MRALRGRYLAALLAAACFVPTAAADDWLVVSGMSYHFRRDLRDWRQFNPGIGLERSTSRESLFLAAGYLRNSYDRHALYAGVRWMPWQIGRVRLGAYAVATTGYRSPVLVWPGFSVDWERFGINASVVPNLPRRSGLVAVQLRFKLD